MDLIVQSEKLISNDKQWSQIDLPIEKNEISQFKAKIPLTVLKLFNLENKS